eukprot:6194033-Pleurochrysis_carterae.AAC.4
MDGLCCISLKWSHPIATLPVTNGIIRHIRKMTEILRITRHYAMQRHAGGATIPAVRMAKAFVAHAHAILYIK